MSQAAYKIQIYGSVQGVGFRFATRQQAQRLGITGYARNLPDGSVEVVACGETSPVTVLIDWLKAGGPVSARVERVLAEPYQPAAIPAHFTTG